MGLMIYITLIGAFNVMVIPDFEWGIKLNFTINRFKGNKSPIYKLEANYLGDAYTVAKYEFKWHKDFPMWTVFIIPFITLFKMYGYVRNPSQYGRYTGKDIKNGYPDESLSYIWEHGNKIDIKDEAEKANRTNSFKSLLDKHNKEFNENYK